MVDAITGLPTIEDTIKYTFPSLITLLTLITLEFIFENKIKNNINKIKSWWMKND